MISRGSFAAALDLLSFLVKLCRMDMIVSREVRLRKGGNLSKLSLISEISDDQMSCDADDILVPKSTPAGLLEPRSMPRARAR